jgi:hypothetical protein
LKKRSLTAILDEATNSLIFNEYQSLLLMKKAFEMSSSRPTLNRFPSERVLKDHWVNQYLNN